MKAGLRTPGWAQTRAKPRPPARLLTPEEVTEELPVVSVAFMGKSWPVDTFIPYLRALMTREGIPDFAELSRLSNVSQTQFSNWRAGTSQPSQASLDKIAPVVHETAMKLYIAAGLVQPSQVELPEEYTPEVLPREILDLIDTWHSTKSEEGKRLVLDRIGFALRGIRSEIAEPEEPARPARRRAS